MLSDCKSLDDYFRLYGSVLGARANQALAPLHLPSRDPIHPGVRTLLRRPFDAQAHVITSIVKAWERQKSVLLAAEMGTGKSLLACSACHLAAGDMPYRAIVMCPDHLLGKWGREIRETIPDATVHAFTDWKDVLARVDSMGDGPRQWYLIGRDQSKFEPAWRPAFARRRQLRMEPVAARNLRKRGVPWSELTVEVVACPRCGATHVDKEGNPVAASTLKATSRLECQECGEPLWSYTRKPYRWAPARILHSRTNRPFDYLVIDEIHEEKSATSAQANAAGKLIASSRKVIALTGTLIGGYAEHVFPMTLRLSPGSLVRAGFGWGQNNKFNAAYGRIETTIHERSGRSGGDDGPRNTQSMGSSSRKVTKRCRPGVMPQLFGDHLIDKTIFLTLEEVRDGLPDLYEEIVPVDMDAEQKAAYDAMADWFRDTIKRQLVMGNKKLLGTMLSHLLGYPDVPFGWGRVDAGEDGSFNPADLDPDTVRPKEEALVELCRREKAAGRQCWVYIQMTQVRDVGERLVKLLAGDGVRAVIDPRLRADYMKSSIDRRKREDWIYKKGKGLDVCISHPKLVETGLDLFAKDGNHNFSTLIYYETGYNLFTLRQSSRRSWRIGQPLTCKTCFLYYRGTMQEQAMTLMGKKMAAAEALEGKFSAEGLAAMAGEDDATMALAKALLEKVDTPTDRTWSRSLGFSPSDYKPATPETPRPLSPGGVKFSAKDLENLKRLHARLCGSGA